jgi:RNA-directed DNA polymerase
MIRKCPVRFLGERDAVTCALLPDRATQHGQVRTAHKLQKLLLRSWYARLLAVRRITQDNRGKHTAGIDGKKSLTPPQRWRLATALRLTGHAAPLRRTWIPKRGSPEKRPLGIPTQADRARQTLVRQALEPEWEAKLAPHTYGRHSASLMCN